MKEVFYLAVIDRPNYGYTVVTNISEGKFSFETINDARDFIKKFPYHSGFDSRPVILECSVVK